jgi:hypothetical protein
MSISVDELLTLLGTKEAELFILRRRLAQLEGRPDTDSSGGETSASNGAGSVSQTATPADKPGRH